MFGGVLMDPILKNIVRVGIVSSVNPVKCTARVAFEDRANTVSYELPVIVRGSLETKDYWLPVPGEQVVCVFLPSGNARGFILGSIYSEGDPPPVSDAKKRHIRFNDGTIIEYDETEHKLTVRAVETIEIEAPKGITLIATDIDGTGVQIIGKSSTGSW